MMDSTVLVFSGLTKATKTKLQTLQNKVIRFVIGISPRSHIGTAEFKKVNWLPVEKRIEQIKLNNIHRIVHGNAPSYLRENVSFVSQQHSIRTRYSQMALTLPRIKSHGECSFRYSAAKLWNGVPVNIRNVQSLPRFKAMSKK